MLTYKEFQDYIKEKLAVKYTQDGDEVIIRISEVMKNNNNKYVGVSVFFKDTVVAPTIYLEAYYSNYCKNTLSLEEVINEIAGKFSKERYVSEELLGIADIYIEFEKVKSQIFMTVVNYENNRELLEKIPYTRFEDLAITYRVKVPCGNGNFGTIQITNEHVKNWNITDAELHKWAELNTQNVYPVKAESMEIIIRGIMLKDGLTEEEVDEILSAIPVDEKMFVISNQENTYGATGMLCDDVLAEIASILEKDLYIIPSSIHECLAVPASNTHSVEELAEMVQSVNVSQVAPEERLSDNVYYYNAREHRLSIANKENINVRHHISKHHI